MKLEICIDTLAAARAAAAGGADRIELCAALSEGGLTPSAGFIRAAVRCFPGQVMVMLRPRCGDFLYDDGEIELMLDDLASAREAGAAGVVFGCLRADGAIDEERLATLMQAANGMLTTFHRAFDVSRDLEESLEILIRHGVDRVLSSGGRPSVAEGAESLRSLVARAAGRIIVLPGGGLRPENLESLLRTIGCREAHLSARRDHGSPMEFRRPSIRMGAEAVPGEYERKSADPELIRQAREALARALAAD